jgi:hypothetical protein
MTCYSNESFVNFHYNRYLSLYIARKGVNEDAAKFSLQWVKFYGSILIRLGVLNQKDHLNNINFMQNKHKETIQLIPDGDE